jgi:hypothetical protein
VGIVKDLFKCPFCHYDQILPFWDSHGGRELWDYDQHQVRWHSFVTSSCILCSLTANTTRGHEWYDLAIRSSVNQRNVDLVSPCSG